jgi:hypothetical protein
VWQLWKIYSIAQHNMKGHYWSVHVMGRKKERKDCFCLLVCFSCIMLNIVYAEVMHVSCVLSFLLYIFVICLCCFLHFVVFVCYQSWKRTAVFYGNQMEHLRKRARFPSCFNLHFVSRQSLLCKSAGSVIPDM